jgi:hypothetical protein
MTCCFGVQNYLCARDEELKLITQIQHINNSNCNNFFKSKWVRAKCSIHRIWVNLTPIRNPISVEFQEFCCSSIPSAFIQVKHMYKCCISTVTTSKLGNLDGDSGLIFKSHISAHWLSYICFWPMIRLNKEPQLCIISCPEFMCIIAWQNFLATELAIPAEHAANMTQNLLVDVDATYSEVLAITDLVRGR